MGKKMSNIKNQPKSKSQGGFSLVELLGVVAIIAVLAAAGIISYTKYISSSQDTVQESNASAIANALKVAQIARQGSLNTADTSCSISAVSSTSTLTAGASNTIISCAQGITSNGNFASAYSKTVTGANYVVVNSPTTTGCSGSTNANQLVLWTSASGFLVSACNAKGYFVNSASTTGAALGTDTFQFMGVSDTF